MVDQVEVEKALTVVSAIVGTLLLQYVISKYNGSNTRHGTTKRELHVLRRLQHMATGVAFVFPSMQGYASKAQVSFTLLGCAIWFYCVHLARLRYKSLNDWLIANFATIARKEEIEGKVPGSFYYLLGSALCCFLFEMDVFHLAILMLAFGDPAAGLVGTLLKGENAGDSKTITGSLAAFVACALVSQFYLGKAKADVWTVVKGGLIGAIGEAVDIGIDDNLTMPIICGTLIHFFMY